MALLFARPSDAHAETLNTIGGPCERTCLQQTLDRYLQAMVSKDHRTLRWATRMHYTENGMTLRLGEGLWATASGIGRYRQAFLDPKSGQAGFIGVVLENGNPVLLGMRLKVVNHRILEVEHIVARGRDGAQAMEALGAPPPIFNEVLTPAERVSRVQLIAAANAYFDGIEQSSGRIVPFDDSCTRVENGMKTAPGRNGRSCSQQFDTGQFSYITEVRDRRFEVVDEETGNVLAFVIFAHPGNILQVQLPGQPLIEMHEAARRPFDTQLAEVFKVRSGRIHQIEAVINTAAFGISSGWEPGRREFIQ